MQKTGSPASSPTFTRSTLPSFFRDNAVNGERQRDPLVLLDAAVVMRVEQRQIARFVERVLLDVQTRAVDVRAQNV